MTRTHLGAAGVVALMVASTVVLAQTPDRRDGGAEADRDDRRRRAASNHERLPSGADPRLAGATEQDAFRRCLTPPARMKRELAGGTCVWRLSARK